MRKLHVLMFAVAALFAFMAVAATSAFAFNELLWNGAKITESLQVEQTGEIALKDLQKGIEVLCSGSFDGIVNAGGKTGEITEVLNLEKLLVAGTGLSLTLVELAGDDISCIVIKGCETVHPVLVVAINLPWDLEVIAGTAEIHLLGVEYYTTECLILGINFENTCSGESWAVILNNPISGDAAAKFEELEPEQQCENGDTASALSDEEDSDLIHPLGGLFTWS